MYGVDKPMLDDCEIRIGAESADESCTVEVNWDSGFAQPFDGVGIDKKDGMEVIFGFDWEVGEEEEPTMVLKFFGPFDKIANIFVYDGDNPY